MVVRRRLQFSKRLPEADEINFAPRTLSNWCEFAQFLPVQTLAMFPACHWGGCPDTNPCRPDTNFCHARNGYLNATLLANAEFYDHSSSTLLARLPPGLLCLHFAAYALHVTESVQQVST